jgi:hypothetical protein
VFDREKKADKRSVFNAESLLAMTPSIMSPVKTIDFLLIGHLATGGAAKSAPRKSCLSQQATPIYRGVARRAVRGVKTSDPIRI